MKGVVCQLIKVENIKYATSLQVAAGAKVSYFDRFLVKNSYSENSVKFCKIYHFFIFQLYNVIVDTQETGQKLLEKGQLRRKVTIIPLNKIAARSISNDVAMKAKNIVSIC